MNHDESDALCELHILFFRQTFSISCHLFLLVLTVGFWGLSELWIVRCSSMVALEDNLSRAAECFYAWRFCHVLLIYDVVFSVRRLKLMFQRQIIRRVAIQSGLQHLSVIHIAYQESDIHAGSQDSFLPAAFVGRRPQESKYFELGSGLLLVTACGMMTKSALLLASNWKLS